MGMRSANHGLLIGMEFHAMKLERRHPPLAS